MAGTRWGIIGPGAIAHNFADGLAEAESGELIAVFGRGAERRNAFADRYQIDAAKRYGDLQAILADGDVDAIYISTPHPEHASLAIAAMRAGKPVLVEKPAGMSASEVVAVTEVAAQEGVFFAEAYMYRCHPQIARVLEIITSGEVGDVTHIRATFGFDAPFDAKSRLYAPELGGGAILDVGGYPMSLARLVAGAALGQPVAEPVGFAGGGALGKSSVDEVAHAVLTFENRIVAEVAVAVSRNMENTAVITGTKGAITIADPWVPGRNAGPSDSTLTIQIGDEVRNEKIKSELHLFAFEAEMASRAVADGLLEAPYPAMSHSDSIGNNTCLDRWRAALGYATFRETVAGNAIIPGTMPAGLSDIPKLHPEGFEAPISQLVMGCDNRDTLADGAIVWDAFVQAGGTTFDTGFVYGGGLHEKVLGDWIKARGVGGEVQVVAKGAHSPYCTPRAIEAQLDISLERLGLDRVPIYIMHRDNLEVPVGEFVDALNELHDRGKIGAFGGSNWTPARMAEANDYAARNGMEPMRILNNNLSLAVMERPIWEGCVTSNTLEMLDFLRNTNMVHMSWSSQARGFFLPAALRNRLPEEIGPDACFGSKANEERRRRAEKLASERGVSAFNIATAWVLAQAFPSIALIGPRSPGEIATTLPALSVKLTPEETAWLNLETDSAP